MRIGFIGTGHIADCMVEGLSLAALDHQGIFLSPRGENTSQRLARQYPSVQVAMDNQTVVDLADMIFISLRTSVAPDVLREMSFGPQHIVVSLVPAIPLATLRQLVTAPTIIRAAPIPSVRRCQSRTPIFPSDAQLEGVFGRLGGVIPTRDEAAFDAFTATTALIKPLFTLIGEVALWISQHGVEEEVARQFVTGQFHSMLGLALDSPHQEADKPVEQATTPGGLNEYAHSLLVKAGVYQDFLQVMDLVLERISPRSPS